MVRRILIAYHTNGIDFIGNWEINCNNHYYRIELHPSPLQQQLQYVLYNALIILTRPKHKFVSKTIIFGFHNWEHFDSFWMDAKENEWMNEFQMFHFQLLFRALFWIYVKWCHMFITWMLVYFENWLLFLIVIRHSMTLKNPNEMKSKNFYRFDTVLCKKKTKPWSPKNTIFYCAWHCILITCACVRIKEWF